MLVNENQCICKQMLLIILKYKLSKEHLYKICTLLRLETVNL
mgnify:CR=1 FL=1